MVFDVQAAEKPPEEGKGTVYIVMKVNVEIGSQRELCLEVHIFSLSLQVCLSSDSNSYEAADQWRDTMANPEKVVVKWHNVCAA